MSLGVGDRFPVDIALATGHGRVSVAQLIATGPAVVAFHRLWCPFCQQAARDLMGVEDQLAAAGARVAIVYREDVETVCASCEDRGIAFDCLSDPERELEQATEVSNFSPWRYAAFSPARLLRVLRSGHTAGIPTTGLLQGRGTFVIDRDGRIVYSHQSATAADIPAIGDIVAAVRSVSTRSV